MKFSVIIPIFNRPEVMSRAIESCLVQTHRDFELVIVDDCSPVPIESIIGRFGDDRVRIIRNDKNLGAAASRNVGMLASQGDYITFLDSDDEYDKERLAVISKTLDDTGEPLIFHRQHRIVSKDVCLPYPARMPEAGERLDEFMLLNGNLIQINAITVRRDIALKVMFDEKSSRYEDTIFVIQCWIQSGRYYAIDSALSSYYDDRRPGRLSRDGRAYERNVPFLKFVQSNCSRPASVSVTAMVNAEIPFFRRPVSMIMNVIDAYKVGVGPARCLIYLLRSMIGSYYVDYAIFSVRKLIGVFL